MSAESNRVQEYILQFNFILGSNFILNCFKLIIIHYNTQKQKKTKFEPRIKFDHDIYNSSYLHIPAKYNTTNMGFAIHHQSFSFLLKMSFLTSTEDIGTMDMIIYGKCQVIKQLCLVQLFSDSQVQFNSQSKKKEIFNSMPII